MSNTYFVSAEPDAWGDCATPKLAMMCAKCLASMMREEFPEVDVRVSTGICRNDVDDETAEEIECWLNSVGFPTACVDGQRVAAEHFADEELVGLSTAEIDALKLNWIGFTPLLDPETGLCLRVIPMDDDAIYTTDWAVPVGERRDADNDGGHAAGMEEKATFCAWIGRGVVVDTNGELHWTDAGSLADTWDRWDNFDERWAN